MSHNIARHDPDGNVIVDRMQPWLAEILTEVPSLLGRDLPDAVRRRLYPDPADDETLREEWERNVVPELWALMASNKQIVERDLAGLERLPRRAGYRLTIPTPHRAAWISALNAARLALGAIHDVEAHDMDGIPDGAWSDRTEAIGKIQVMGWLQAVLVEGVDPESARE